ncbi:sensor histidine kinase [Pseudomonas sp. GL-RE-29]|jgi:signal transduction histidine kinase|uniref:sensor histidine kinase n=1 Tax=Pseudomonas sp. GL-RE-29 TaxID=2832375 RepID=UPI001CBEE7AD|nr:sensor histidine kinase [Pseudomonas sp. GL-RE-29]
MISSIAFQTRARTIDHLGREQIADCPTAISELWKNSYDAYSRTVGMHVYDGEYPVATIVDNGHGMNCTEFKNKWLVVGTESKTDNITSSKEDMCGLQPRVKQGQKGIGRLSSANLGSLLLIVSKRKNDRFVASLIDWRIFENPYLFLMDIEVPVIEFDKKDELFLSLPEMFEKLIENVNPIADDNERNKRILLAWEQFTALETSNGKKHSTHQAIQDTVVGTLFEEWHFSEWPLWRGESEHGTILVISDVQSDLLAQLPKYDSGGHGKDSTIIQARDQLFQTLSNISDPFLNEKEILRGEGVVDFSTKATARDRTRLRTIVDDQPPFDLAWLHELEHVVDGNVDPAGIFRGKVKAFGEWLEDEIVIQPAIDIPSRKDSLVGPFNLRLGTYEQKLDSTSHSEESYRSFEAKSDNYAGFLVYRNGLRVMPYGREGTDFFQIEKRRTLHAGREFWSLRRLFGRVALDKFDNPNLRDKAGREGIIDNKAAKVFRDLVINILKTLARSHFGTASDLRKITISERVEQFEQRKLEEGRNKQRAQKRKVFNSRLNTNEPLLINMLSAIEVLSEEVTNDTLKDEEIIVRYKGKLSSLKTGLKELVLPAAPRNLGLLEEKHINYRTKAKIAKEMVDFLEQKISFALDTIKPKSPRDIAYSELNSNASFIHRRIRGWVTEGKSIIATEQQRLQSLQDERNKVYHAKTMPLLDQLDSGTISLSEASRLLDEERDIQDAENSSLFESYVTALNSLSENIDLASLVTHSDDLAEGLREEVDRLHALAQLGITVEIIGHEIESLEQSVSTNLKLFPQAVQESNAYIEVRESHEALIDRLRFLSPLKLSGPKTRAKITGQTIYDYVLRFFKAKLDSQNLSLSATEQFLRFSIHDQPARIMPVFINLINNSIYWVEQSEFAEKHIILQIVNGKVAISDNGPGVRSDDINRLFQLFFTRKVRGGRGVGLYLCKANLAASGHSIVYSEGSSPLLSGANFLIDFKGAKYD